MSVAQVIKSIDCDKDLVSIDVSNNTVRVYVQGVSNGFIQRSSTEVPWNVYVYRGNALKRSTSYLCDMDTVKDAIRLLKICDTHDIKTVDFSV